MFIQEFGIVQREADHSVFYRHSTQGFVHVMMTRKLPSLNITFYSTFKLSILVD